MNKDRITVFIITDINTSKYSLPPNAIIIPMSIENVRERAAKLIFDLFQTQIEPKKLIHRNFKLEDYKVAYPMMFSDILKDAKKMGDFVGFTDCDCLYGNFSNFVPQCMNEYQVLGELYGHFFATNTEAIELFLKDSFFFTLF